MKNILKKIASFLSLCAMGAGLLFVLYQKVFYKDLPDFQQPAPRPDAVQPEAEAAKKSRALIAQKNKSTKRKPQKFNSKLKPPTPAQNAYQKLKKQQIFVSLLRDKFFTHHRLSFPAREDELYDVQQTTRPKAEHLHIHGPFGVYFMVVSVFDKMSVDAVFEKELKTHNLFEDEVKVLPAPRPRNSSFIKEVYHEWPGKGYRVTMIGQHRITKKTILLRFRTSTYNRYVGQFVQKKYRHIRVH